MGEMKAIKGFIILDDGTRLSVSKIVTYDSVDIVRDEIKTRIYYMDGTDFNESYISKYTLEEIDEAIIKAQL